MDSRAMALQLKQEYELAAPVNIDTNQNVMTIPAMQRFSSAIVWNDRSVLAA